MGPYGKPLQQETSVHENTRRPGWHRRGHRMEGARGREGRALRAAAAGLQARRDLLPPPGIPDAAMASAGLVRSLRFDSLPRLR